MNKLFVLLTTTVLLTLSSSGFAEAQSGADVYRTKCAMCHDNGVAGAPKPGDAAAWAPRLEQGQEGLLASAIKGKNAMPPRGTCMDCTDEDLAAAIQHMTAPR